MLCTEPLCDNSLQASAGAQCSCQLLSEVSHQEQGRLVLCRLHDLHIALGYSSRRWWQLPEKALNSWGALYLRKCFLSSVKSHRCTHCFLCLARDPMLPVIEEIKSRSTVYLRSGTLTVEFFSSKSPMRAWLFLSFGQGGRQNSGQYRHILN